MIAQSHHQETVKNNFQDLNELPPLFEQVQFYFIFFSLEEAYIKIQQFIFCFDNSDQGGGGGGRASSYQDMLGSIAGSSLGHRHSA